MLPENISNMCNSKSNIAVVWALGTKKLNKPTGLFIARFCTEASAAKQHRFEKAIQIQEEDRQWKTDWGKTILNLEEKAVTKKRTTSIISKCTFSSLCMYLSEVYWKGLLEVYWHLTKYTEIYY